MAAKKQKGRKVVDDWDGDLGETVDANNDAAEPVATEPAAEPAAEAPKEEPAPTVMGGGLLATLKNRGGKGKKGKKAAYADWEDEIGEDAPGAVSAAPAEPAEPVEEEPKAAAAPPPPPPADEPSTGAEPERMKTKKEKEREKKEREKQRKKEQAAKKKTGGPAPAAAEIVVEEEPVEVAAPDPVEEEIGIPKGKKVPAHIRALQKQQDLRRKQQEEQARLQAEEKARQEELERKEEEDRKAKEEAKALKKQREKEKVEQMKRDGTYMTKAQKEAARKAEIRRDQMLKATGIVVPSANSEGAPVRKKPVYNNKKKKGPAKTDTAPATGTATPEPEAVEEVAAKTEKLTVSEPEPKKAEKEEGVEDWEQLADDGVKDSWDMSSEDEADKAKKGDGAAEEDESDDESEDEPEPEPTLSRQQRSVQEKADALKKRDEKYAAARAAASTDNLRSPIGVILGHVDTGKTSLLDKIRQTNVQEGEAGGITQQIGATYFPVDALEKKTAVVNKDKSFEFKVPGLLVIDTPGHESFTNLRSRGSSLCNIAILVIDLMHGLEPQTIESIQLLRERKTPFIVALNKIDRLYSWKPTPNCGFQESYNKQSRSVQSEFRDRLAKTKLALAEQGLNSELFYENKQLSKNVSLVPTSAHTGEGVPDLLKLLVSLTQERMASRLMYLSEIEATILEVKVVEGLGTTIDVILSNGILREGDRIVLCGINGPIKTNIRALLTPAEMRELRVKSQYVHNKEVKAAMGVKIAAEGLDSAIAGSRLLVVGPDDDEEDLEDEVMSDLEGLLSRISTTGVGVSVQASTLGSLEALLEFLRTSKIPVANISIGPVFKRDVMQCGAMMERSPEHAVMLCFDVKVDKEADQYAKEVGVKIFTADIIYHLFDAFTAHLKEAAEQKKEESKMTAVFPCVLRPVAVFNKKDPIVIGVDVIDGALRMHTPISAVRTDPATGRKEIVKLGRVTSIERDHKALQICRRGEPSVAVKIEGNNQPLYGRQLEEKDILYSAISRKSIDTLKQHFKADVSVEEWRLIVKLKPLFDIS